MAIFYKLKGSGGWSAALQRANRDGSRSSSLVLRRLDSEATYELMSASVKLEGQQPTAISARSPVQVLAPSTAATARAMPRASAVPLESGAHPPSKAEPSARQSLRRLISSHGTTAASLVTRSAAMSSTSASEISAIRMDFAPTPPLAPVLTDRMNRASEGRSVSSSSSTKSSAMQTPMSALMDLLSRGISGEQLFYVALGSVLSIGAFLVLLLALLCCVLQRNSSRRRQLKRLKRRLSSNSMNNAQAATVPLLKTRQYKTLSPSRPNGILHCSY